MSMSTEMSRNPTATDPVGRLVKKLGGPTVIAGKLGASVGSVIQWRITGRVPMHHRFSVKTIARRAGIKLTKDEWTLLQLTNGTR